MKKIFATSGWALILLITQHCSTSQTYEWHEKDGYRVAELSVPRSGKPGFKQLSPSSTGITFANNLTEEQISGNRVYLNGSGVAVGDVDSDGLVDLYFCRLNGSNVLYKNLGNWQFEDITNFAGVACPEQFSTGTALADIDGDGDLDLLVTALGKTNRCFLNDGAGKFTEVTKTAALDSDMGSTTIALSDIDDDGDLDLYIANYKKRWARDLFLPEERTYNRIIQKVGDSFRISPKFQDHSKLTDRDGMPFWEEYAEADMLYLNDGKGRFNKVSFIDGRFIDEAGNPISEPKDWGLRRVFRI